MSDSPLDLKSTPVASAAAAPEVQSDLVLVPPAPVPVVGTAQASSMMPIDDARSADLAARAKTFIADLVDKDPKAPEFAKKINDVAAMGRDEIRSAAAVTNRMLERPVAALAAARGTGDEADAQRKVANTLVELRLTIEDLDPTKQEGGIGQFLLGLIPFRDKIRSYFAKYASAQTQLDKILHSLQNGQDALLKDNAAVEGEKMRLWDTMNKLQEYAVLTSALDAQLVASIEDVRMTDPAKADILTADLLFAIRQKHQDLLTQLAVSAQGYLALDVVRKNNVELIKGVERASTTTISALRTAVIVAQALANQKLVLDQITALNTTTSNLIVATSQMLKSQSAAIAEQSTSATISLESLETAFQNIYDTIDQLDTYKVKAVETMAQTVTALQSRLAEATEYLDRAKPEGIELVMRRPLTLVAVATTVALLLTGCIPSFDGNTDTTDGGLPNDGQTLRVLAGSEVKDMVPLLEEAAADIGVKVAFEYVGTLEGTELVASGGAAGKYDAIWFPNNRYLSLLPGASSAIVSSVKIMSSPVVLGLRQSVAKRLGWDGTAPTWADLAAAASDGEFTYGMTNPAASNSGFSALVAVATALSGTGSALTDADITAVTPGMTTFFSGQKLTAGSSGFLADKFTADPDAVDGIINYESVLRGLDIGGEPLTIVTPTDGVVTSDYPLTLLSSADASKKPLFDSLTAWLTTPEVQKKIVEQTNRRPGVPGIDTGSTFPDTILFETPFPNTLDVANTLISTYLESVRSPAQTLFVLDTSGSMEGDRLAALKQALKNLAGADESTAGGFAAFRSRERVTLLPFNDAPGTPLVVDVPDTVKTAALEQIRDEADGLVADGGTAIYDSLEAAYKLALKQQKERPDTFVSIVLMTDGENTDGSDAAEFAQFYSSLADNNIATFVVLFGNGNVDELTSVAELTGGKVFDALNGDLAGAFQEIRGYQ